MSASVYSAPQPGASLLLALRPARQDASILVPCRRTALVIGTSQLAAARTFSLIEADFSVLLCPTSTAEPLHPELIHRLSSSPRVSLCDSPSLDPASRSSSSAWRAWLVGLASFDDLALIIHTSPTLTAPLPIRLAAHSLRIPLSVADHPSLSDFSFPATHRWPSSALQLAVSSGAGGCRVAVRVRRECVSKVGRDAGEAVEAVRELRKRVRALAGETETEGEPGCCNGSRSRKATSWQVPEEDGDEFEAELLSSGAGSRALNKPVAQRESKTCWPTVALHPTPPPTPSEGRRSPLDSASKPAEVPPKSPESVLDAVEQDRLHQKRARMRWVAQISEYWPLDRIAELSKNPAAMDRLLESFPARLASGVSDAQATPHASVTSTGSQSSVHEPSTAMGSYSLSPISALLPLPLPLDFSSRHQLELASRPLPLPPMPKGRILLVGSGPGHPSLLTLAAYQALTVHATLVLSDKLVPTEVLALLEPRRRAGKVKVEVARKYPGNAEVSQGELLEMALEGARRGETVVRLKQGDPYLYGRGGEELLHFTAHGFAPVVIPGVSSALAAPLMFDVPVTQRGAAESLVVCTGVGRRGKGVRLPSYERGRTLVVLMGVARLDAVVAALVRSSPPSHANGAGPAPAGGEAEAVMPGGEVPAEGRREREGAAYPAYTPIAIIERASSPDQRMVASTLSAISTALASSGEQRPPGMMVIGWSVLSLFGGRGDLSVLDDAERYGPEDLDARDLERVERWLGEQGKIVKEGLDPTWDRLMEGFLDSQRGSDRGAGA